MIMKTPSNKGSAFEREICATLSIWWTQDLDKPRDDIFYRTASSGGRATTRAKGGVKTANSYGDVTFIDPVGQPLIDSCLIELKRGYTKDISLLDFIDRAKGTPILLHWWYKASEERVLAGREYVLLIFRRDRHLPCIILSQGMMGVLYDHFGKMPIHRNRIYAMGMDLVVMRLDDFLKWVHPNFFIRPI
jgi:hypothetical protein